MVNVKEGTYSSASGAAQPAPDSEDLSALIEEILRQSDVAIRAGSSLPFEDGILAVAKDRLRPEVAKHLGQRDLASATLLWQEDSTNALKAATIFGMVSTCVARLRRQDKIDADAMTVAFELVQKECNGQFGPQGCWCGC